LFPKIWKIWKKITKKWLSLSSLYTSSTSKKKKKKKQLSVSSLIQSSSTSLLAGLATATHLNSHKIPFLLLEASDAVGGDGQRRSSLHPSVSLLFFVLSHSQSTTDEWTKEKTNKQRTGERLSKKEDADERERRCRERGVYGRKKKKIDRREREWERDFMEKRKRKKRTKKKRDKQTRGRRRQKRENSKKKKRNGIKDAEAFGIE